MISNLLTANSAFMPLKETFLEIAYQKQGMDLGIQRYLLLARRVSEAISQLPLTKECPVNAEAVLGSSVRILAHLQLVDYIKLHKLDKNKDAVLYINLVKDTAQQCLKLIANELSEGRPLHEIYIKTVVREGLDTKFGFSDSVPLEQSQELDSMVETIFKEKFTLVAKKEKELHAYMSESSVDKLKQNQEIFYRALSPYMENPRENITIYPQENEEGPIFGSFFEPRDFIRLRDEIVENNIANEVKDVSKMEVIKTTLEKGESLKITVENRLKIVLKQVSKENSQLQLEPLSVEFVHVQDHYPLRNLVKVTIRKEPVNKVRDQVYATAKENPLAKAPEIKFPRISLLASKQKPFNLKEVEYASKYLEGFDPTSKELITILQIGIRRFVSAYLEKEKREDELNQLLKYSVK